MKSRDIIYRTPTLPLQAGSDTPPDLPPPPPPLGMIVSFSGVPLSGEVPLAVIFTPTINGGVAPYTYAWDFGDGGTSTSSAPTHAYLAAGTYDVTLVVTDANGLIGSSSRSGYVTGSDAPPPPDLTPPVTSGDIVISGLTSSGYTATCPVYTDTSGILKYQYRIGLGGTITDIAAGGRSVTRSGLSANETIYMRGVDASPAQNVGAWASYAVTLASSAPTSVTLTVSSPTAVAGGSVTVTATLDAAATATTTVNLAKTASATLGSASIVIAVGQISGTTTMTDAVAEAAQVSISGVSPTLTVLGSPKTVTWSAPAAPGALPSFTLVPGTTGTLPFAFGHVFRQGDVPAGQVANAASATDWQCTPLTYWPDDSLKHAIIAGRASVTSGSDTVLALTAGSAAGGTALTEADLAAALPATTIAVDADTTDLNALIGTAALHTTVCTGPVMSSWVYRRPVAGNSHLVVFAEVRLFKGGAIEIFPSIENGYLSVASPSNFVRTCTVTIGGVSRFSQSIDIKHHTRIPLINGTSYSYWVGTDPQITPKHDTAYLVKTGLVPNVGAYGSPSEAVLNDTVSTTPVKATYSPNTLAGDDIANGASGGSGGAVSVQCSLFLASAADVRAWRGMMVHALSAGSWSCHYRDEATNLPIAFSARPLATLADTSTPTIPTPTGGENAAGPAMSHAVSYAYLPWLVTGRWWFLEEIHFWTTFGYLSTSAAYRGNGAGWHVHAQPRFRAWCLSVLAQSAAITPAAHPLRAEFLSSWEANTSRHYGRFVSGTVDSGTWVSPIGVLGTYSGAGGQPSPFPPQIPATGPQTGNGVQTSFPTMPDLDMTRLTSGGVVKVGNVVKTYPTDWTVSGQNIVFAVAPGNGLAVEIFPRSDAWWDGAYQQNYLAIVFGYTRDIGIPQSAQSLADHIAVSNHAFKLVVGRAGDGLHGRYNWRRFAAYGLPVGTDNAGIPLDVWYSTHDQVYAELVAGLGLSALDPAYGGTLKSHSVDTDLAGSSLTYGSTALAALALAVDHEAADANLGWERVTSASNYSAFTSFLANEYAQFSVKPRLPDWRLPASGEVIDLGTGTVNAALGRTVSWFRAWTGVVHAASFGRAGSTLAAGGGHTDGRPNDWTRFDLFTRTHSVVKAAATAYVKPPGDANAGEVADRATTGWMYANATAGDTTQQTGESPAQHFWGGPVWLPENAIPGLGATYGWIFSPGQTGTADNGNNGAAIAHKLRVGIDQQWTLHGTPPHTRSHGHCAGVFDPIARKVWFMNGMSSDPMDYYYYKDLPTGGEGTQAFVASSPKNFIQGYESAHYSARWRCTIHIRKDSYPDSSNAYPYVLVIDPATNTRYRPIMAGPVPTKPAFDCIAATWSDKWNRFAYISGTGEQKVWFGTPSGDLKSDSCTITWTSQDIDTGTLRAADGYIGSDGRPAHNRLHHAAMLGDFLEWAATTAHPFQLIGVTPP